MNQSFFKTPRLKSLVSTPQPSTALQWQHDQEHFLSAVRSGIATGNTEGVQQSGNICVNIMASNAHYQNGYCYFALSMQFVSRYLYIFKRMINPHRQKKFVDNNLVRSFQKHCRQ